MPQRMGRGDFFVAFSVTKIAQKLDRAFKKR